MRCSQESSLAIVGWQNGAGKSRVAKRVGKIGAVKKPHGKKASIQGAASQRISAACFFVVGKGSVVHFGGSVVLHSAQLFQEFFSLSGGSRNVAGLVGHVP